MQNYNRAYINLHIGSVYTESKYWAMCKLFTK